MRLTCPQEARSTHKHYEQHEQALVTKERDPHLQGVVEDNGRPKGKAAAIDGTHNSIDNMWTGLKDVRPHIVQQVCESILAAHPCNAKAHMLHNACCRLRKEIQVSTSGIYRGRWNYAKHPMPRLGKRHEEAYRATVQLSTCYQTESML